MRSLPSRSVVWIPTQSLLQTFITTRTAGASAATASPAARSPSSPASSVLRVPQSLRQLRLREVRVLGDRPPDPRHGQHISQQLVGAASLPLGLVQLPEGLRERCVSHVEGGEETEVGWRAMMRWKVLPLRRWVGREKGGETAWALSRGGWLRGSRRQQTHCRLGFFQFGPAGRVACPTSRQNYAEKPCEVSTLSSNAR